MKQRDVERVMAAAWEAALPRAFARATAVDRANLHNVLREVDPHGAYRPGAPQPPAIDLDETQDIPLRDSPRMPREPENL